MLYGEECGTPFPITFAWISKGLRKYVKEDKFGVHRKGKIKIPLFYKLEYSKCKKHREQMILLYYEKIDNLSELDKMEKEKLLRLG